MTWPWDSEEPPPPERFVFRPGTRRIEPEPRDHWWRTSPKSFASFVAKEAIR
jgi:hypothetical protein